MTGIPRLSASKICFVLVLILAGQARVQAQTTYTFSTSTTSPVWTNSANWTGNTGHYPGLDANPNSTADGAATDIAVIGAYAFPNALGINMAAGTNTGVGNIAGTSGLLSLGAIVYNFTGVGPILQIGDSSSVNGILRLNGATVDTGAGLVSNVILAVPNSGGGGISIWIQPNAQGGTGTLTLQLGSTTSVLYTGTVSPTTGHEIRITSGITEVNPGSGLTIRGDGQVAFGGINSYTGATTIMGGTVTVDSGGSLAAASAVTVNAGTLCGIGTVNGSISVNAGATLHGGQGASFPNVFGTLSVNGTTTLHSGSTLSTMLSGGNLPPSIITGNSKLANGGTINFDSSAGPITLRLLNDQNVVANNIYSMTLATGGAYQKNGVAYDPITNPYVLGTDYLLIGDTYGTLYTGTVVVSGGNLVLTFSRAPVPEPASILVVVGAAGYLRHRWTRLTRRVRPTSP